MSSENFIILNKKNLSFDDFLMTTWEPEVESQRKKEPQILHLSYTSLPIIYARKILELPFEILWIESNIL